MSKRSIAPEVLFTASREDGLGRQIHVRCLETDNYYFISENTEKGEALVFPSGPNGGIRHYHEVAGGAGGYTASEILEDWAEGRLWITDPPDCDGPDGWGGDLR